MVDHGVPGLSDAVYAALRVLRRADRRKGHLGTALYHHRAGILLASPNDLTELIKALDWLAFLDTYRTMCLAPEAPFRRVREEIRGMRHAA